MSNFLYQSLPNGSIHTFNLDGTEIVLDQDKKTVQESENGSVFKVESDLEVTLPTGLSDRWSAIFIYEGKEKYGAQDTQRAQQNKTPLKGKRSTTDVVEFIVPEEADLREFPRTEMSNIRDVAVVVHFEDDTWLIGGEFGR